MKANLFKSALLVLFVLSIMISPAHSITKVPARLSVMDFYFGYSIPTGNYDGFHNSKWSDYFDGNPGNPSVAGDEIFKSGFKFGLNYGQIRNDHLLYSIGFAYTNVRLQDSTIIPQVGIIYLGQGDFNLSLYDIDFNLNYFMNKMTNMKWSPFIGLGLKTGFYSLTANNFNSDTKLNLGMAINFGFDVKIWEKKTHRNFVTLSSVNSYDFLGTGDRPKYLNLGLGLKYYFRP